MAYFDKFKTSVYARDPVLRRVRRQFVPPAPAPTTVRSLISSAGRNLAYVTMRCLPEGVSLSSGAPFFPATEIIFPNASGSWLAYVRPVADFSDPTQFYLITEYFSDGRTKVFKARILGGTGVVLLKDVLI